MKNINPYKENLFKNAGEKIFRNAKELRLELTDTEKVLWAELRRKSLKGYKFRRQHPIDIFIADFYCHKANLVIEVDGGIHDLKENREYDEARTTKLNELGIRVIRFRNEDIENKLEWVMEQVKFHLLPGSDLSPNPSPEREGL